MKKNFLVLAVTCQLVLTDWALGQCFPLGGYLSYVTAVFFATEAGNNAQDKWRRPVDFSATDGP